MTAIQTIEIVNELLSKVLTENYNADIKIRVSLMNYLQKRDRISSAKIRGEKVYYSINKNTSSIDMTLFRQNILDNYNFLLRCFEDEKYVDVTSIDLVQFGV